MLIKMSCKDSVSRGRKKLGIRHVLQYFSNEAKIRDISIVVQIMIKTPLFENRRDKS